MRKFVAFFTFF